jgi:hypothetical protein
MATKVILVTGFGPFPGAPFNPTGQLVERLARLRRPALNDVTIVPHVFQTSYAAVDHDLPKLIARHKPDALLMFGLASRSKTLRIETRARNAFLVARCLAGKSELLDLLIWRCPPTGATCLLPYATYGLPSHFHAMRDAIYATISVGGRLKRPWKMVRVLRLSSISRLLRAKSHEKVKSVV